MKNESLYELGKKAQKDTKRYIISIFFYLKTHIFLFP